MAFPVRKLRKVLAAAVIAALPFSVGSLGCMPASRLAMQAQRYRIELQLDPAAHTLVGRTTIDLVRADTQYLPPGRSTAIELCLHPDLRITGVATGGVTGRYRGPLPDRPCDKRNGLVPQRHLILLQEPVDAMTVFVDYEGTLFQDVSAGEKPGEIHNFTMRAHIGEDGIYLSDGPWYPEPFLPDEHVAPPAEFELLVDPVPGMELVAGAQRDPVLSKQSGRLAWRSPYPVDGMVLVGGAHEVHRAEHNGVLISAHLKPDQAKHAEGLLDTIRRNLDRYEPLIGPYPADEFAIVDNFFSSGFAFPTFTLLSSAVINMGQRAQTAHGYIDHEMLHCWWGNGIFVDPADGNWCEALASYGANYYGYVLDGNELEARRKRRNYVHFLSRIKPENDKPLGTFGQKDGCSRGIAYSKGAVVFHMLARKIGQENLWAALRRLTAEFVGRHASWDDIRTVCEQVSGVDLSSFFQQWVRRGGAPTLVIDSAAYDGTGQTLTLAFSREDPPFDLDVPIRVTHAGGAIDIDVALGDSAETVTVPLDVVPIGVELDPDYHLFRKVPLSDIVPTTARTRYGKAFACVTPAGEVPEGYSSVRSVFESSFEDDERILRAAGEIEEGALADRCTLILGDAVHDPYVAAFLSAIEFPVRFTDGGFEFDGKMYADPGQALLCTVGHPGVEGGGVTVVYANGESALPPAAYLPMYDRSLVIFDNKRPIVRHDFETHRVIPVEAGN